MQPPPLEILYEDNHLLAVSKRAGLPTMGVAADRPALLVLARQYIKDKYAKPGNVYLGIVSRLDAPVTGVVLLARTSKAARRLAEQFRSREVQKAYWALVEGAVREESGELTGWIAEDERHRRMHLVGRAVPGAKEARLAFRRLKKTHGYCLLEICPETGRKHQIRLQLAALGHPILGDRKYGSQHAFPAGIALHARRLVVMHPVRNEPMVLEAPVPAAWHKFGVT